MLTSGLITLIQREFPDWGRATILDLINEIQRMVFTQNTTKPMRMYDSTTGKDPILTTTASIYEYDIDTTNGFDYDAWRVCAVYEDDIYTLTDCLFYDATPGVSAKVVFKADPGSNDYYLRVYRQCTSIGAETTQLEIPASFHITHVFEGVCGLIEKMRSGKSERLENFINKGIPEITKKLNDPSNFDEMENGGY